MDYSRSPEMLKSHVDAAMGRIPPDMLLVGGEVVNTLTGEIYKADVATKDNRIVRVGDISDLEGQYPGIKHIDCR